MYTLWNEFGERNLQIEHSLSSLENEFSKIRISKLNYQRSLDVEKKIILLAFAAAMDVRTKTRLKHFADQWKRPLELMDELAEKMKTASLEEKQRASAINVPSSQKQSLTHEQVRGIVENPVGTIMIPALTAELQAFLKLDMAILTTENKRGFITSDSPCVWYDSEAYKRPPMFRSPGLAYKSTEITLPISPSQCLLLNRHGINGYIPISDKDLENTNKLRRFNADMHYVVNTSQSDDYWFEPGIEPEDSWEKQQADNE